MLSYFISTVCFRKWVANGFWQSPPQPMIYFYKEKKRDCNSSIQQLFQHCGKSNNMIQPNLGYYKHQMKEESLKSTFQITILLGYITLKKPKYRKIWRLKTSKINKSFYNFNLILGEISPPIRKKKKKTKQKA